MTSHKRKVRSRSRSRRRRSRSRSRSRRRSHRSRSRKRRSRSRSRSRRRSRRRIRGRGGVFGKCKASPTRKSSRLRRTRAHRGSPYRRFQTLETVAVAPLAPAEVISEARTIMAQRELAASLAAESKLYRTRNTRQRKREDLIIKEAENILIGSVD